MASGSTARCFSLDEVVAERDSMTIPGPLVDDDDWSDDECEGYVDESEDEQQEEGERDNDNKQLEGEKEMGGGLEIGGECEVREDSDLPSYSLTLGCNHPCDNATPLEFFRMLVTDNILGNIVTQTNLYASQYISTHNLPPQLRVHSWSREQFTREELQKFISLIIVIGLVNLPTLEDHWVTAWPYTSQTCSKASVANT